MILRPAMAALAAIVVASSLTPRHGAAQPVAPESGYRAEFFQVLASVESDYLALAEAMPESTYGWRPGEGVRSVGEVYLHVAMTNFTGPTMIGASPPPGLRRDGYEQSMTSKARIVAELRRSFEHLRGAVLAISDGDGDVAVEGWYGPTTYRGALHIMNEHLGEHLGQSIAYARVNGIVPPWNR